MRTVNISAEIFANAHDGSKIELTEKPDDPRLTELEGLAKSYMDQKGGIAAIVTYPDGDGFYQVGAILAVDAKALPTMVRDIRSLLKTLEAKLK